jgi:HNH endonuclease/NUMOD4 motif
MEMLDERWAPVRGYEGMYEVSDCGRIKSVQRFRRGKSGGLVPMPEKIMKTRIKKRNETGRTLPYVEIRLRDGSPRDVRGRAYLVHRLVAQAYVGELFEGAQVDHIDGDHGNNRFSNLQILSAREHGLLHPCIQNPQRNAQMHAAAQETIRALRAAGKIQGRLRADDLALDKWKC